MKHCASTNGIAQLNDHPEGSDLEFRITRADGEVRWGVLSWTTIYDRDGQSSGVQGSIHDITHRKAVEAATWRRSQELAALNLIAARLNQSLELENNARRCPARPAGSSRRRVRRDSCGA